MGAWNAITGVGAGLVPALSSGNRQDFSSPLPPPEGDKRQETESSPYPLQRGTKDGRQETYPPLAGVGGGTPQQAGAGGNYPPLAGVGGGTPQQAGAGGNYPPLAGVGGGISSLQPNSLQPTAFLDDRDNITPTDRVLLIVEDDLRFANILLDMAHDKGFKAVITDRGEEAVNLAQKMKPAAITLDLRLPDIDGWTVLDRIKLDPSLMHIPVHIISIEEDQQYGLERGAFAYLTKPVTKESLEAAFTKIAEFTKPGQKKLLIVEDNETEQLAIAALIGNGDVLTKTVTTGKEALKALKSEPFDCVVLDLGLPDMTGAQVLEKIKKEPKLADIPIIIYTGKEISKAEETELKRSARTVIVKGSHSSERLLAETSLFLHRVTSKLPKEKRQIVEKIYKSEAALTGKKVLVVDDDVRNLFALTSLLESHNMVVLTAENGKDAIASLKKNPETDLVLMDIMMPEMDGYETMKEVRKLPRFKELPIIALTAKAMKGDREKCLEAGASDYITKPVNTEQLLSLMRVWLYR
ncbi:MAG: response regulator [Nitrospirota bacterium]